jgi:glycosyltransferase involved in cell wall biosynthesis
VEARRPLKVVSVSPEPTPYRAPLFDRLAALPDLDLLVVYAARTVAGRTWDVPLRHPHVVLRGRSIPGASRVLRHDYPLTPGVLGVLRRSRPDCVVVSGWSTFASQAAIAWCRARRVPYVLVVESHDRDPRSGWRRTVKQAVVPRVVRAAAAVLVTGSLARESMIRRGACPEKVRVFANTVDVRAFGERAARLAARRSELRRGLGLGDDDVAVLSAARLVPEKALDVLLRAAAEAGHGVVPVLAGDGPERSALAALAQEHGLRVVMPGALDWERIVEAYVACDVFALLSRHEPWGVVVNEAAACGLPLVLSEYVGAAHDLLVDGENGILVPVDDVAATSEALRRLARDPELRRRFGARSRELAAGWGYEPSVEAFRAAVEEAAG